MIRKTRIADLPEFDMASQLKNEEDIAAYVTMVIEDGDAAELAHALGVAAKARGMSEIAQATGITREALYKALKPNAKPRFDTINRVCAALGVRLVAQPVFQQLHTGRPRTAARFFGPEISARRLMLVDYTQNVNVA